MRKLFLFVLLLINGFAIAQSTYLAADFSEKELDTLLSLCQKGGLEGLLQTRPFLTYGHYLWNPDFAKNGDKSVAMMVQKAESAGVKLGILIHEDAISLNDAFFSTKYYDQLLKEGEVQLRQSITADDDEFVINSNEFMKTPSSLNLLLVENEIISYGTYEYANGCILLYQCSRGDYGTRRSAHQKNAKAHKLWDSPYRFLAPGETLRDSVRMYLTNRINNTGLQFLLPVGATRQELLDETVRVRHVERWSNETDPQMGLGWIYIHAADKKRGCTTMEEIEWMMSKAVGFDMGYGLVIDKKAVKQHGGLDAILEKMSQWNQLLYSGALSESQRKMLLDPYQDWHLEKTDDDHFQLFAINKSRSIRCAFQEMDSCVFISDTMEWKADQEGLFGLRIQVDGKKEIRNPMVSTSKGLIFFDCTIKPGQSLIYDFEDVAHVVDANCNIMAEVVPEGLSMLPEGASNVNLICEMASDGSQPEVALRYITREPLFSVTIHH